MSELSRREIVVGGSVIVFGGSLAGCSGSDPVAWVQGLLTTLANIQSEVRSRLAGICTTANSMVPSIDMALEALKAAMGVTTIGAGVAILATAVEAAVGGIVAAGCPAPNAPTAAPGVPPVATTVTINGKPIPVKWV